MNASSLRQESDFLGSRSIPAAAYWGVHTARAVEVAKTALANRATIDDTARSLGVMSADDVQALLVPDKMTRPSPLGG
jgi:aspartate ammonia-lyase